MFLEHLEKHLDEAIGRIGWEPLGVREMADGIKGTKEIRRAID